MAARTERIAITTSSSIKVKAERLLGRKSPILLRGRRAVLVRALWSAATKAAITSSGDVAAKTATVGNRFFMVFLPRSLGCR